jgi:hypothetical protein
LTWSGRGATRRRWFGAFGWRFGGGRSRWRIAILAFGRGLLALSTVTEVGDVPTRTFELEASRSDLF